MAMSQSVSSNVRRLLGQDPAAFQRQCRVGASSQRAVAVTQSMNSANVYRGRPHHSRARARTAAHDLDHSPRLALFAPAIPRGGDDRCRGQVQIRGFCRSTVQRATTVLQNPRVDEDGNEMRLEISDRAANRLQQIISASASSQSTTSPPPPPTPPLPNRSGTSVPTSQKQPAYNHLRVSVTSGGCHGFQYLMSLEPASTIESDVDTVFGSTPPTTSTSTSTSTTQPSTSSPLSSLPPPPPPSAQPSSSSSAPTAKVVLDDASLELLKGSTVDYTTELIGSQFTIRGNPRAKSSCGCGTSFDIED